MREIQAEDDEQSLEGGVEDEQEDPLEDALPPMLRDEKTQDCNNIPHRDDNLVDENVVHQSQGEPDNLST